MVFYFPKDADMEAEEQGMPGFVRDDTIYLPVNYNPNAMIPYNSVAGGYYSLDSVSLWLHENTARERHQILVFRLVLDPKLSGKNLKQAMYYSFPFDACDQSVRESAFGLPQTEVIPRAILWDDVTEASSQLKGKSFYARFPIKIEKKVVSYQHVCITDVEAGKGDAPIRIHYAIIGQPDSGYKDVITSGNNVLPVLWKNHLFSDYFQSDDPQETLRKAKINYSTADWTSICEGKVVLGMDSVEVSLALGPAPTVIKTDNSTKGASEEWDYDDQKITMEKGLVTQIVHTSGKSSGVAQKN